MDDSVVQGPWDDVILKEGEVKRIIKAFLSSPNRINDGATDEEILQVIKWAREIKLKAAINVSILREVYLEQLYLDLDEGGEIVMGMINKDVSTFPPSTEEIEEWLNL
jgi:hypothetical protein